MKPPKFRHAALLPLLTTALLGLPQAGLTLPTDREQPIEIQADNARLDEREGTAVYVGNVDLQQGTLNVTAAHMTIWFVDDQVTRIRAVGEPGQRQAHYEQQPEPNEPNVLADADELIYEVRDQLIHLSGSAVLVQSGDRFEGEKLRYDIRAGEVAASGENPDDRIRMTLQPERMAPAP